MEKEMSREERLDYLKKKIDKRIYKTKEPKVSLNNKFLFVIHILVEFGIILNLVSTGLSAGRNTLLIFAIVWAVAGLIVCTVTYIKNNKNPIFSKICLVQFIVLYFVAILANGNSSLNTMCIPLLVSTMPFMNKKQMNWSCIAVGAANVVIYFFDG